MRINRLASCGALVALVTGATGVTAQPLASRIAASSGNVAFSYNTAPNVCGTGTSISIAEDELPASGVVPRPFRGMRIGRHTDHDEPCEIGPARVTLTRDGDSIVNVRVTVGGTGRTTGTDLGSVPGPEGAAYLLSLARRLSGKAADAAILGAAIADRAVIWKELVEIARDNGASAAARKASLFWLSHFATPAALAGVDAVAEDETAEQAVRQDALFYIAQRPNREGVPALIRVVRESRSAKLRKDAIWYLSQSDDPRALALFEELLARR